MKKHVLTELRKLYVARAFDLEQVKKYSTTRVTDKIDALLKDISREIKLVDPTETDIPEDVDKRLRKLFARVEKLVAKAYRQMYDMLLEDAEELAEIEALYADKSINKAAKFDIIPTPTKIAVASLVSSILIQGDTFKDSFGQQAVGFNGNFQRVMRMSAYRGETMSQLLARTIGTRSAKALGLKGIIKGVTDIDIEGFTVDAGMSPKAKRNVQAIIRTGYQAVSNRARMNVFEQHADVLRGYENLSVLDGRTTKVCIAYSGARWDLNHNPIDGTKLPFWEPPRHWGCRSILIPLLKEFKELEGVVDIPEGRRTAFSRTGMVGQVPLSTTFDGFMKSMSEAEQNEIIGKGRAELWRAGKISLSDMINPRNKKVLTLKQLRSRTERL